MSYAWSLRTSTTRGFRLASLMADDRACARPKMPYVLPNDPATNLALAFTQMALGVALVNRQTAASVTRTEALRKSATCFLRQDTTWASADRQRVLGTRRATAGDRDGRHID